MTQIACLFDHGISDRFSAYIVAVAVDVDRILLVRTVDLDIIGDRTDQRAAGDGECAIATNSRAVCAKSDACAVRVHPVLHRAAVHVEGGTFLQLYDRFHVIGSAVHYFIKHTILTVQLAAVQIQRAAVVDLN